MSNFPFGQTIRKIAEKKGISQSELAKIAGVSRVQINRIFNATSESIREETRQKLLDALGINCDELEVSDALKSYKQKVVEKYSVRSFAGMGFVEPQKRKLDSFYVSPKAVRKQLSPTASESKKSGDPSCHTGLTLRRKFEKREEPTAADAMVMTYPNAIVLGAPGSGKTTLVQFMAQRVADGKVADVEIPVVVRLAEFALALETHPEIDFIDWIVSRAEEVGCSDLDVPLRQLLEKESRAILFLLDGLDEVPESERIRSKVVSATVDFVRRFPNQRYVVTSRPAGFDPQPWSPLGFEFLELQEYKRSEIEAVVKKWSSILSGDGETSENIEQELLEAIFANERVRQLAANPLVLTILIVLCKSRGYALPRRRVDLYAKLSEVFLESWEASKRKETGYRETRVVDLDTRELAWLVADLALAMQRARKVTAPRWWIVDRFQETLCTKIGFSATEAKAQIDPILRFISTRAGLLAQPLPDVFAFEHRTFQEYFASLGIIEEAESNDRPMSLSHLLKDMLYDSSWQEVVQLVSAQVSPARAEELLKTIVDDPDPLGRFLGRGTVLALRCLSDGTTISNRKFTDSIFRSLLERGGSEWLGITAEIFATLDGLAGTRYEQAARAAKNTMLENAQSALQPEQYQWLVFEGCVRESEIECPPYDDSKAITTAKMTCRSLSEDIKLINMRLLQSSPKEWFSIASKSLDNRRIDEGDAITIFEGIYLAVSKDKTLREEARSVSQREISRKSAPTGTRRAATRVFKSIAESESNWQFLLDRILDNDDDETFRHDAAMMLGRDAFKSRTIREMLMRTCRDRRIPSWIRSGVVYGMREAVLDHPDIEKLLVELASKSNGPSETAVVALKPVSDRYIEDFKKWAQDDSPRAKPACEILASLYAAGKVDWDSFATDVVALRLSECGHPDSKMGEPCPCALNAIREIVVTRDRIAGMTLENILAKHLLPLETKITSAFLFGSVARADQEADSDVDLMLIGDLHMRDLASFIKPVEKIVGRRLNPAVYSLAEFTKRNRENNTFVKDVMGKPKSFVKLPGKICTEEQLENELGRMV
ncbi:MAG: NACHT domain-containing protein [Pirellulaceae bacterium]